MSETKKTDLRINGSGSASGGSYNSIRINGSGRITGDVDCSDFVVHGSGEASGKVECKTMRINGSGRVGGELKTDELKVNGSATFHKAVMADSVSVSGSSDMRENLNARTIKVSGSVKVDGDCSAEEFDSDGLFEIDGLLNAGIIDISLYWHKSHAKEIGGEKITVSLGKGSLGVLASIFSLGTHYPSLEAYSIEGDEITLENTTAKIVRGNNITIGNGCNIGFVEYKGSYRETGDAKVGEHKKV